MNKNITPDEIIDALGGTGAVARIFGIKDPSVSEWRKKERIPRPRLMFLELKYKKVFSALETKVLQNQKLCPAKAVATTPDAN